MSKILIYPYDISNLHLIQYVNLSDLEDVRDILCITPKGWGYDEEDAGCKIGLRTGINVKNDFFSEVKSADIIVIVDSLLDIAEEELYKRIVAALRNQKEVIILRKISAQLIERLQTEHNGALKIYGGNKVTIDSEIISNIDYYRMQDMPIPVICVIGTGETCGKFDVQLALREFFLRKGIRISQIGSKTYSEFFGFHSFPEFMLDKSSYTESEKIVGFNSYIIDIYQKENSDVFIIGIPGGISSYDNLFHNRFGITNFLVANAICPDYVILNTLYFPLFQKYLEDVVTQIRNKYNYDIDKIFVFNSMINTTVTKMDNVLTYTTLRIPALCDKIKDLSVSNIFNESSKISTMEDIFRTLTEYADLTIY